MPNFHNALHAVTCRLQRAQENYMEDPFLAIARLWSAYDPLFHDYIVHGERYAAANTAVALALMKIGRFQVQSWDGDEMMDTLLDAAGYLVLALAYAYDDRTPRTEDDL